MTQLSLKEILQARKQAAIEAAIEEADRRKEPELPSDPFPLAPMVILCLHANREDLYFDDWEGLKLLATWLGPFEPLPTTVNHVPPILANWLVHNLAEHLKVSISDVYKVIKEHYSDWWQAL